MAWMRSPPQRTFPAGVHLSRSLVVGFGQEFRSSTLPGMDARSRRLITLLVLAVAVGAVIVATVVSGS